MKFCIFCEADCTGRRAKEHIFSQDLLEEFCIVQERLSHSPFKIVKGDFSGGYVTDFRATRSLTYSGFVAGKVCASCNNGWMNQLEKSVRPYLYPLMRGEMVPTYLSPDQCQALSCWCLKTSIALSQSIDAPQNFVPPEHAKYLYEKRGKGLPNGVSVFALPANTDDFLWSLCPTWKVEIGPDVNVEKALKQHPDAYKTFIQLGKLMLLCCYWPQACSVYRYESWGVTPIGGRAQCEVTSGDCREQFAQESDQLMMSVGVYLETTDA